MASLSSVNRSNGNYLSSLMNSANTITGLASGLDTESMIESLVQSYQMKINQFNQKITKLEWKQEAYRSIISNMYNFSNKYASYTSSTNLMSKSFFTNSVNVSALGKFADAVIASGKSSSSISLNAVHQLATSASYRTSSNMASGGGSIEASEAVDIWTTKSALDGTMKLDYGDESVVITFDAEADGAKLKKIMEDNKEFTQADALAQLINDKLRDARITVADDGEGSKDVVSANTYIKAEADGDRGIKFIATTKDGTKDDSASVSISYVDGNMGIDLEETNEDKKPQSFSLSEGVELTYETFNDKLSGKSMDITLNGVTKTITTPTLFRDADGKTYIKTDSDSGKVEYSAKNYAEELNKAVQKAFGDKIEVTNKSGDDNKLLKLSFSLTEKKDGSTLTVKSEAGKALGLGETATNYLDTSKTLGELMGDKLKGLESGKKDENENDLYDFVINGVTVGSYTKDTKLSDLMNDINNSKAGVKVSYSKTTQNFLFETKETGADAKIEFGGGLAQKMFGTDINQKTRDYLGLEEGGLKDKTFAINVDGKDISFKFSRDDGSVQSMLTAVSTVLEKKGINATAKIDEMGRLVLEGRDGKQLNYTVAEGDEIASKLVSRSYTAGQDAIFNVTVNGETMQMTRSSNTVDIDGMSITMKDTFNSKVGENGELLKDAKGNYMVDNTSNAVTFKTSTDSDKIIDAIKSMISDYNSMMADIKSAYSTMPYQSSNGSFTSYEPLTDDDMEGMTESAIARYEEKAKQGLLFGDQNLSGLYNGMLDAFSFNNTADVDTLRAMGISVSYNVNDGSQTITLDEDKLRDMLDSDPDRVADLFTKSGGIMDRMKTQLDRYGKTTGEPKGILVQQAGTPLSSLSLMSNNWQNDIDNYNKQIEKWQMKLQTQVERYTSQFSRLEQLINQMNSQSSALAGLMGG